MRLVAITRVLNDDDIIEAFIRHHSAMVDHHLILDTGSTDRTHEILRELRAEGIGLTTIQARSVGAAESDHATFLFHHAVQVLGADWVVCLDPDDFVDERRSELSLRGRIGTLAEDAAVLKLRVVPYSATAADDPEEALVPRRIRHRLRERVELFRVAARRDLVGRGARVEPGAQDVLVGGTPAPAETEDGLVLAQFGRRSAWQQVARAVTGRLRGLASGQGAQNRPHAAHDQALFDSLRDDPAVILLNEALMSPPHVDPAVMEDDPIRYLGSPLTLTQAADPRMKAVRSLLAYAEALATQHGRLLDENGAIRLQAGQWGNTFSPLA